MEHAARGDPRADKRVATLDADLGTGLSAAELATLKELLTRVAEAAPQAGVRRPRAKTS
ncbi:hypothetical protein [Amycolatopsis silviterrae]|uniref:MarR family transcriptional regulator n=1 Tax=Amycolatopsis silviterrae TaxID=1656914 RepID=A0ABW5H6S4_9PSEU